MYEGLVEQVWNLSDLMVGAAGLQLFSTVLVASGEREILAIEKGWAGGEPEGKSCAPYVGPLKAMELLMNLDGTMAMTPTSYPLGCGWMGGVRRCVGADIHHITSGSAWSERCDAQHALVLNYATICEVRFHHVGFRHPTREAALAAVDEDEKRFSVSAVSLPAKDHYRWYIPVETDAAPNGVYWREHQFFPAGDKTPAIHWDLATTDAFGLLDFVAGHLKADFITWKRRPNDPVGVTWEQNRDGVMYGVMTRPRWCDIGK